MFGILGQNSNLLEVSFLDVGQGDATFIKSPSGFNMLVDTGVSDRVFGEISKRLPFYSKKIDILVLTHPDLDHIGKAPKIIKRFDVGKIILSGDFNDSDSDKAVYLEARKKNIEIIYARRGQGIVFPDGLSALVLFPDRDAEKFESNTASIGLKVSYGEVNFILTGDMPSAVEKYLTGLDKNLLDSEVLKAGHHGSKTSSNKEFVNMVSHLYSIISAGKDNRYGHPHKEALDNLSVSTILGTYDLGTITFKTDGVNLYLK